MASCLSYHLLAKAMATATCSRGRGLPRAYADTEANGTSHPWTNS